ncbi:MAG: DNA-directed RNA polymerase subunit L [Candidatus Diapherotrites archaeon]|nr:DNA-directed RNA polymerase subunit L [Candidatus Diapherotrites archaeon]
MKIDIVKENDNELELKVLETNKYTLSNLITKVLLEDKAVEFAAYNVDHPLGSNAIIYVKTDGSKKARSAVIDAIEKIKEDSAEFVKKIQSL